MILSLLLALNAHACDCVPRELPELFEAASMIATVKARSAKDVELGKAFEVEAIQVWKGDRKAKEFRLKTGSSTCAYSLTPGEKYLVFASASGKELRIDGCDGTKPLADANKDILWMKLRKEGTRK